jgi:hypothetical protein
MIVVEKPRCSAQWAIALVFFIPTEAFSVRMEVLSVEGVIESMSWSTRERGERSEYPRSPNPQRKP